MTTTIRRFTAAVALPAALLFTFTACGGDDGDSGSDDTSSESNESTESDDTDAAASPEAEGTDGGEAPEAGSIPDPVQDPEGFEAYLADMYVDAGMTEDQATCMADAFMDNVDVSKANDPSAITELMNDPKLQEAVTACV